MWIVYLTGNAENQRKARFCYKNTLNEIKFPFKTRSEDQANNVVAALQTHGILSAAEEQSVFDARVADLEAIDNAILEQ